MKWIVVILSGAVLGLGLWFWPKIFSRAKFTGFPGTYACEEFGLPDRDYSTLKIDGELNVYGVGPKEVHIGRLKAIDGSATRARIHLSNELVHEPTFALDPFAEHRAEGVGDSLILSGTRDGRILYSHPCYRR